MKKPEWHFLLLTLVLAFFLRLYRVTNPVADWHAFRQADTASVSREYLKHGIDLLHPKYHDLSNIQSGQDNLEGYRMVEFPLINGVVAAVTWVVPGQPLVLVSRLISVGCSLLTIVALYFLVKRVSGVELARATAVLLAVMPYTVYYSRVVLPEPAMLCGLALSLWWFQEWLESQKWTTALQWFLASLAALMVAVLLKPYVVFVAPVYLALAWHQDGPQIWKRYGLVIYGLLAVAPYLWWRHWISQFPAGIPKYDWLFNGNGIRWRPAWWRWLGYERLTKLMLGGANLFPVLANALNWRSDWIVYGAWWLGILAYVSVIASGNVQHDYYQVLLIPIVAISIARGYLTVVQRWPSWWVRSSLTVLVGIGLIASWSQVAGYYNVNHWEYVRAGAAVDRLTPPDALVIAPAFGDTQFLFQTNRRGWPIGFEISDKIELGAEYYITTSMDDEARQLQSQYQTLEQTPEYLLLDLTQPLSQP